MEAHSHRVTLAVGSGTGRQETRCTARPSSPTGSKPGRRRGHLGGRQPPKNSPSPSDPPSGGSLGCRQRLASGIVPFVISADLLEILACPACDTRPRVTLDGDR